MYESFNGQVGLVVPPECSGSPEFATCVMAALQKATQVPECEFVRAGPNRDKCVAYYHEFYTYEDCRGLCSTLKKPEKPASWTESPPTSGSAKKSGLGSFVSGMLVGGASAALALALSRKS